MKAEETKRRLLDASVALIAEQGLDGLSLREMARRASVSHQAPYHHFENREGLLAAIAEEGFAEFDRALVAAREASTGQGPRETLRGVLRAYMTFALGHPVHFRLMFRPDIVSLRRHPTARANALRTLDRLVDAIAACHPNADRDSLAFEALVHTLWAGAHGVATLILDGPVRGVSEMAADQFVEAASALYSEAGATTRLVD